VSTCLCVDREEITRSSPSPATSPRLPPRSPSSSPVSSDDKLVSFRPTAQEARVSRCPATRRDRRDLRPARDLLRRRGPEHFHGCDDAMMEISPPGVSWSQRTGPSAPGSSGSRVPRPAGPEARCPQETSNRLWSTRCPPAGHADRCGYVVVTAGPGEPSTGRAGAAMPGSLVDRCRRHGPGAPGMRTTRRYWESWLPTQPPCPAVGLNRGSAYGTSPGSSR
jgi:hypothetical protein